MVKVFGSTVDGYVAAGAGAAVARPARADMRAALAYIMQEVSASVWCIMLGGWRPKAEF